MRSRVLGGKLPYMSAHAVLVEANGVFDGDRRSGFRVVVENNTAQRSKKNEIQEIYLKERRQKDDEKQEKRSLLLWDHNHDEKTNNKARAILAVRCFETPLNR